MASHSSAAKARILLVEDEAMVRESTAILLERNGYETVVAGDGDDGVKILENGTGFDLLLTDVIMPGSGGQAVVGKAREMSRGVKVLMFSAYPRRELERMGELLEGVDLLAKPFRLAELIRRIDSLLNGDASE